MTDGDTVDDIRRRYAAGDNIGDGEVKMLVADSINELLEPMRERRERWASDDDVMDVLLQGSRTANAACEETLAMAKEAAQLRFFPRTLELG